jgi:hypothetical protein
METAGHLESGDEWGRLQSLLELVRQEYHRAELSPERHQQIRERVLERLERYAVRRRRRRALGAAASAVLLAGLALFTALRFRARTGATRR